VTKDREAAEEGRDEVEDEITQTTSPDLTNTWTDLEEDFREIMCWTVSFTTYNPPDLKRYDGNLNCMGFTDTDCREGESCNTPSCHRLHMIVEMSYSSS
jgi:hypothetical protein